MGLARDFLISCNCEVLLFVIGSLIGLWLFSDAGKLCQRQWRFMKSASKMPGPPALPLIGNALHFACKSDDLLDRIIELGQPYNEPFRFWMGPKLFVVLRNPRDVEVLLNSPVATKKPPESRFLASYLGPGIVTNSVAGRTPVTVKLLGEFGFRDYMILKMSTRVNLEPESEIAKWYQGKAIFMTGATGFMGKVLLEKLLRSCPGIGPIYLLVRAKKQTLSQDRVDEMLASSFFAEFHTLGINSNDKIVAIPGDVGMPDLGISSENRNLLQDTVSVVFHVAATVRFDEHLRLAVAINLEGTKSMLELCKGMRNLCAVVHVSTAYANCTLSVIEERVYPPPADPDKILQYVRSMDDDMLNFVIPRVLNGHPNTYTFTKALAEDVISKHSSELPIVIVRPSIVLASWKEPQPGWIDSFNGPTAFVVGGGKGLLKSVYGRNDIAADLMPVDVCINLFIAAAWEIGSRERTKFVSDVRVYNCVSSPFKPQTWDEFIKYVHPSTIKYAMNDVFTVPGTSMTSSRFKHMLSNFILQDVPAKLADFCIQCSGGKPRFQHYQSKLSQVMTMLEFFTTRKWSFEAKNVTKLKNRLNSTDRKIFDFDMTKMNWEKYVESYFLGIRRGVLKEDDMTIPDAQKRIVKMKFMAKTMRVGFYIFVGIHVMKYYMYSRRRYLKR